MRMLDRLDAWMDQSPWHPRVAPFFVYIVGLMGIGFVGDAAPAAVPPLYVLQCGLVAWLLWRYRRLTPELNLRWHWSVLPSAVVLLVAWVGLGYGYNRLVFGGLERVPMERETYFRELFELSAVYGWAALILRLLGMSLLVPFFEELFVRSAVLRALHDPRSTWTGLVQFAADLPVVGDAVARSDAGRRAEAEPPAWTRNLERVPLGAVTVFATLASTVVFAASHGVRDWAGCVACGVVWCAMVGWTNRPSLPEAERAGLGPVIWSHGLVNALLWGYTLISGDWQFL